MSTCNESSSDSDPVSGPGSSSTNPTIAQQLLNLGPRTVEGDQGRATMHGARDAIAVTEYERKRTLMGSRAGYRNALRTVSGIKLRAPGGRAE